MFNQRQIEIVLELCENYGQYMTASYFAEKQQVSLRTIQNDMRQIKDELADLAFLSFQSTAPKGSRVMVKDLSAFADYKENLYQKFSSAAVNYQGERLNQLLLLLLNQHRAISLYDVENTIFVSHSTLINDLKRVMGILQKYDLELMRGSNKVMVDGNEINKRRCLSEEKLLVAKVTLSSSERDRFTAARPRLR